MTKLVLFAGLVTLAVTGVRLYGELHDWDPKLSSKEPGGQLAWIGISWLIFVFGFWFGARLARAGAGPRSLGTAFVLHAVALAMLVGGAMLPRVVLGHDPVSFEDFRTAIFIIIGAGAAAALVALVAWPRLWWANFCYALLARIPVVIVTYIACDQEWGTHYEKMGPSNLAAEPMVKAFWLSFVQMTLWPEITVLAGGMTGTLAAALFRRRG